MNDYLDLPDWSEPIGSKQIRIYKEPREPGQRVDRYEVIVDYRGDVTEGWTVTELRHLAASLAMFVGGLE